MLKFKDFFLNVLLISLVFIMFVLVILNWSAGLNLISMPNDFLGKDFIVSKYRDAYQTTKTLRFATPSKIAIRDNDNIYSAVYSNNELSQVYDAMQMQILLKDGIIDDSTSEEYNKAFQTQDIVFLEFFCPISSIAQINSELFVSNMIIKTNQSNTEIYIKSKSEYKKIITNSKMNEFEYKHMNDKNLLQIYNENIINILSDDGMLVQNLSIVEPYITSDVKNEIISAFLYNPLVVTNYSPNENETIYINENSTVSINQDYVEFESNDSRGNIFYSNTAMNNTEMIDFSLEIFDLIYKNIGSSLVGHAIDLYKQDNQTIIILSSKYQNIGFDTGNYSGIFSFSDNGLSYCKIDLVCAKKTDSLVNISKTLILEHENNIILSYTKKGVPTWRYLFDRSL